MKPPNRPPIGIEEITAAHQLYCELTGQKLTLAYNRQRDWYELLRAGFDLSDLRRLILYLQKEIREQRRNMGALKLSNLLQLDRFEEDLALSRVRLRPPQPRSEPSKYPERKPAEIAQGRQRALAHIRSLKAQLTHSNDAPQPTNQSETHGPHSTPSSDNYPTK